MREDRALAKRLSLRARFLKALQKEIESRITPREGISTSVEVPLTVDAKQALSFATEEASRFGHKHVESEHIVWIEALLWEDVPSPEKTPNGLCRRTVMLGRSEILDWGLAIYSVQVTPLTRI